MQLVSTTVARCGLLALLLVLVLPGSALAAASRPHVPDVVDVVNGSAVSEATYQQRWPFIVAIMETRARTQFDGQFCGGALIDARHVLTAAHCLSFDRGVVATAASIKVLARTRVLSDVSTGSGEQRPRAVEAIFVHPDFDENHGEGFRNDVAVLRLREPVANVTPIRIVGPGEEALWGGGSGGVTGWVAGWGDTDPRNRRAASSKFPTQLQEAPLPIHADAACSSTVGGGYGTAFERASNLCGGTLGSGTRLGRDACQGDSGGPLIVAAGDGSWRLAGTTSWGKGCAEGSFGVYARLASLRSWIETIPGALDGGAAVGGPSGTHAVTNLRVGTRTYTHVQLRWEAPLAGPRPERYAIWRRTLFDGKRSEELIGITTRTAYRARVAARPRSVAYTWVVRPLDAAGSNGPIATVKGGARADARRPTRPQRVWASSRSGRSVTVRWTAAVDRQSGLSGYQVQHRVVGARRWRTTAYASAGTRRALVRGLAPGTRVQVRVRAIDHAENRSVWSTVRTFATRS